MTIFLYLIHVLACLFLILVVLLQQGSGADLSVFGGGGTMTAFGARGATSLLHKLTVSVFVIFIVTTLSIGVVKAREGKSSVMSDLPDEPKAEAPAPAALPDDSGDPEESLPQGEDPGMSAPEGAAATESGGEVDGGDAQSPDADSSASDSPPGS